MVNINLKGLGVALVTPFNKDFTVDYKSLKNIINHIITGGCDYIVVLGTTAETPTLSAEEKNIIARYVYETVDGRVPLILGIGGNNTAGVVNDILSRDLTGYSAILSVAPYYNRPSQEGLFLHFKTIADSSPLPVILYNVPGRTGVNISASTTLKLAEYSPKICAIKEASGKIEQCEEILRKAPEGFAVISGNDADTSVLMALGAKGVISVVGNAFPKFMKKVVDLCSDGYLSDAVKLQNLMSSLVRTLFEEGNPAGIKALLANMGLCDNVLRLPLVPVSKYLEEKILSEVSQLQ